jgi:RND family efflux transporter MFP subunit
MFRSPIDGRISTCLAWSAIIWLLTGSARDLVAQSPEVLTVREVRLSLVERALLAAERTGVLDRVHVREGDVVAADAPVAQLRDQLLRAQLEIAERHLQNDVDLRFSRKAAELANLEFAKSVKVNEGTAGTISEMELRRLRLAGEKALLQLEQAQLQLDIARLEREEKRVQLAAYQVIAPWSGVVLRVHKRRGEAVREGEPIVELADLSKLRAEGVVSLADALKLQPGQPVRLRVALPTEDAAEPARLFEGTIVFIEPKVDAVTQRVRFWAEIANDGHWLKEGMQGTLGVALTPTEIVPAGFSDEAPLIPARRP